MVFAAAVPPYLMRSAGNPDGPLTPEKAHQKKQLLEQDRPAFFDQFVRLNAAPHGLNVSHAQAWAKRAVPPCAQRRSGRLGDGTGRGGLRGSVAVPGACKLQNAASARITPCVARRAACTPAVVSSPDAGSMTSNSCQAMTCRAVSYTHLDVYKRQGSSTHANQKTSLLKRLQSQSFPSGPC